MNNICFFTSIGNNLTLIDYIKNTYDYDIVCNYYGENIDVLEKIKEKSVYCENNKICKFPALKKLYDVVSEYDYIFIYDDDALVTQGSLDSLINIAYKYKLDLVSSAHCSLGKISWPIHLPVKGNHLFRYVNFIELNFPIFSKNGLKKFMDQYDGLLCDWGVDYWYSYILQPEINFNMAIVDSIVIHNPKDSMKLDGVINPWDRVKQMDEYLIKFNIPRIEAKTIGLRLFD